MKITKKEKGFTIIEVLIVLAIAGVIMAIVFLAVPALQRGQRNTQRRSDAAHMASLISEWQANHPSTTLTKVNDASNATGPDLTSETFSLVNKPAPNTAVAAGWAAPGSPAYDTFYFATKAKCQDTSTPVGSTSAKDTVVVVYLEPGNSIYCNDQ